MRSASSKNRKLVKFFFLFFLKEKIEFTKKIILVNLIPVSHDDRSSNESFDGHYCKYFVQKKL